MREAKGKEMSLNSPPFLNLVGVNKMVAVYTKRRLKNKQTNKIHDCLEWSHSPKKICVSLINQISLRTTDQKAFKLVQFLRTKGYIRNQALLSGLGPQLLALLDSCLQHRCSHQAEWSGQNIPRRLLGSHVHLRPQTMDGPGSVEKLTKE